MSKKSHQTLKANLVIQLTPSNVTYRRSRLTRVRGTATSLATADRTTEAHVTANLVKGLSEVTEMSVTAILVNSLSEVTDTNGTAILVKSLQKLTEMNGTLETGVRETGTERGEVTGTGIVTDTVTRIVRETGIVTDTVTGKVRETSIVTRGTEREILTGRVTLTTVARAELTVTGKSPKETEPLT